MRARRLFAVALAFVLALAVFAATRGDERAAAGPPAAGAPSLRPDADTDAQVRRLQTAVRRGAPREAELAAAYLQKARESGDPSFYSRADGVLRRALARGPADPAELVEAAALAAGRHDFREAERLARRARALAPDSLGAFPILVDALVELGRYGEAERTLQRMVDLKPNLPAYARVSYFRELTGDLPGAAQALRLAVAAGGPVPENVAYVQSLLGSLELNRGRLAAARRAYAAALAAVPGYAPARGRPRAAGRPVRRPARRDRALAPARRAAAAARVRDRARRGRAGRRPRAPPAARDLALVRAQERLLAAAGVNTDVELAIYEADHGDRAPRRAAGARGVGAGAERALGRRARLGADPRRPRRGRPALGAPRAAARLARPDVPLPRRHRRRRHAEGRRNLRLALAHGLDAHPLHANRARAALEDR